MPYTTLTKHLVRSRTRTFERTIWLLDRAAPGMTGLMIFLDAELYIERTSALQVVRRLREARLIPQVPSLFVSNNGAVSRHEDFTCNSDYAHFIAHDVVNWARKEYPGLRDVIIVGLSLSGLAATYIAARHPAVFRAAICQSPSFWWEKARFANDLPTAERPEHEFWISVGSRETDTGVSHPPSGLFQGMTQVASCSLAAAALRAKGYGVSYREYDGGHDPNCWREDLALALPWVWRRES